MLVKFTSRISSNRVISYPYTQKNGGHHMLEFKYYSVQKIENLKDLRNWISKHRRRIETTFAQLDDQFHVNEILANSLSGLKVRLQSKILGHNISYLINKYLGNKANGQIKHLIFG